MAMDVLQINDISLKRNYGSRCAHRRTSAGSAGQRVLRRHRHQTYCSGTRLLELLLTNEQLRTEVLPLLGKSDYEELATASIFTALIEAAG